MQCILGDRQEHILSAMKHHLLGEFMTRGQSEQKQEGNPCLLRRVDQVTRHLWQKEKQAGNPCLLLKEMAILDLFMLKEMAVQDTCMLKEIADQDLLKSFDKV